MYNFPFIIANDHNSMSYCEGGIRQAM